MRLIVVLLLLLSVTYAKKHGSSVGQHNHHHGGHHDYLWPAIVSHYFGVSTLVALKVKVVVVAVALLAGAAWFFYFHQGKLGGCPHHVYHDPPPPPPPHHYEERPHRKRYRPHRERRGLDVADVFAGKTSFANLTFDVLNIETESCRRKFVCDLDALATIHPVLQSAVAFVSGGLDVYREAPSSNSTTTEEEDCTLRFPDCSLKFHRRDFSPTWETITIFPTVT